MTSQDFSHQLIGYDWSPAALKLAGLPRWALCAVLLTGVSSAQPGESRAAAALPPAVELLFRSNQALKAAEQSALAAHDRVRATGLWPDPVVEYTGFVRPIQSRDGPIESQAMLGQKIPLWGQLSRQRTIAATRADIAGLGVRDLKLRLVYQLRSYRADYVKLTRSLEILNAYRSDLESFRQAALTSYATGVGLTQHPILKLQIEMSLIESQVNTLSSQLESAVNLLQALYDGNFIPDTLTSGLHTQPPELSVEVWLALAERAHPRLQIAQREHQIAIVQQELAVRKGRPNLIAGMTYSVVGSPEQSGTGNPGGDAVGVKLGLNLPLWFGGNRARVQAAQREIYAREATTEEVRNGVEQEVRSAKKQLDELGETYQLYAGSLVQEAEQMLSSAYAAYETDKINFLDLLDSERMIKRVRLEFEAVQADRHKATARLLMAAGNIQIDKEQINENF